MCSLLQSLVLSQPNTKATQHIQPTQTLTGSKRQHESMLGGRLGDLQHVTKEVVLTNAGRAVLWATPCSCKSTRYSVSEWQCLSESVSDEKVTLLHTSGYLANKLQDYFQPIEPHL